MASSRRSWSLSSLPPEITQLIFYKTPAESLVRSKPTCKKWRDLITDKTFINEHFQRSQERFIRASDDTVQIMNPSTGTSSVSPLPNELLQYPFKIDTLMVHCDGYMLVAFDSWKYRTDDEETRLPNLALWNPVLRHLRWIEPGKGITSSDYHGIGFKNKGSDGYKILRFTSRPWVVEGYGDEPEVEIYECKTSSWRTLDLEADMDLNMLRSYVGVLGNMYWTAYRYNEDEELEHQEEVFIRCFDFSDETFKDICYCPPPYYNAHHLGCFNGDSLSLLQQDEEERNIDVWVSSKLVGGDGDVSFSKYFSLSGADLPGLLVHGYNAARAVYCFVKPKRVIAWCVRVGGEGDEFRSCFTLYEIDENGVRKETETERDYVLFHSFLCGYVYVPSMIPLPWL